MHERAFGYAWVEIWVAEAEGIRMLRGGIQMPESEFVCPRRHSDTIKRLLHGGYSDAETYIRIYIEAIRILEESIRMPTTQKSRTRTTTTESLKQIDLNLAIVLGNQNKEHYTLITNVIT